MKTTTNLPVGTRVTLDPAISNLRRIGTVIEPNLATADGFERVPWDNDRAVFRYPRTHLKVASPAETGFESLNETGQTSLGSILFTIVAVVAIVVTAWAMTSLRDPAAGTPAAAPDCHVVIAGADHDPEQADSDINWVVEMVYKIDYRGGDQYGTWWVQDTPEAPWYVLGYSVEEDSTVWNDVDCLSRS